MWLLPYNMTVMMIYIQLQVKPCSNISEINLDHNNNTINSNNTIISLTLVHMCSKFNRKGSVFYSQLAFPFFCFKHF